MVFSKPQVSIYPRTPYFGVAYPAFVSRVPLIFVFHRVFHRVRGYACIPRILGIGGRVRTFLHVGARRVRNVNARTPPPALPRPVDYARFDQQPHSLLRVCRIAAEHLLGYGRVAHHCRLEVFQRNAAHAAGVGPFRHGSLVLAAQAPAGRDRLIMAAYALPVTLGRVSMASASLAIVGARTLPQPPTGYAIPSKRDLRVSRYGRASGMSRSSRRA